MEPDKIKPIELPSMPMADYKEFPKIQAVYFVHFDKELVYIGKSINLRRRWSAHDLRYSAEHTGEIRVSWLDCTGFQPRELSDFEASCITYFKPLLNGHAMPEQFTFRLPEKAAIALRQYCDKEGLILSVFLERAVMQHLVYKGVYVEDKGNQDGN